jgi:hypothetical protein
MPGVAANTLDAAGVWDLVHYLRSIIPTGAQALASPSARTLVAARLEGATPESPDDPRFATAKSAWIAFAPFHDAETGPPGAFVSVLAGERVLAFRFVIPDATADVPGPGYDGPPDGIAVRVASTKQPPVLPFPGQMPRLDRAVWLSGPMPDSKSEVYDALPRFDNPEGVCRMVLSPDRGGAGVHRSGSWYVALAVRTDESRAMEGPNPTYVSFAPFDGSLRRGPMPVGFSAWNRVVVPK